MDDLSLIVLSNLTFFSKALFAYTGCFVVNFFVGGK